MHRPNRPTGFPGRLFVLARETFEASVAIHYHAPWQHRTAVRAAPRDRV